MHNQQHKLAEQVQTHKHGDGHTKGHPRAPEVQCRREREQSDDAELRSPQPHADGTTTAREILSPTHQPHNERPGEGKHKAQEHGGAELHQGLVARQQRREQRDGADRSGHGIKSARDRTKPPEVQYQADNEGDEQRHETQYPARSTWVGARQP